MIFKPINPRHMKRMKTILSLTLICVLIALVGTNAFAQPGKDKPEKTKATEKKEMQKAEQKAKPEAGKKLDESKAAKDEKVKKDSLKTDKDNEGQGHAYGKNKGGLEGKEFGQSRAEQAKLEQKQKEQELGTSVEEGDAKVMEAREKIAAAKEQAEKEKMAKKISEAAYQEKMEKINNAEKAVDDLEMKVKKAKEMQTE